LNNKMSRGLPVGMHVQFYSETGSVGHCFWRKYVTLKAAHAEWAPGARNGPVKIGGSLNLRLGGGHVRIVFGPPC